MTMTIHAIRVSITAKQQLNAKAVSNTGFIMILSAIAVAVLSGAFSSMQPFGMKLAYTN
jgi:uncharacterized membrane protein